MYLARNGLVNYGHQGILTPATTKLLFRVKDIPNKAFHEEVLLSGVAQRQPRKEFASKI
jgi:hypothetical protein